MPTKIQPAITTLSLRTQPGPRPDGSPGSNSYLNYVDTARELSKVNRRLYSQARMYGYQGLSFIFRQNAASVATIECTVRTAGNTWIVQNAHTKGEALWNEMQALVLEDNPSIAGKWHDFKVQLDANQIVVREMFARDGAGTVYAAGEWDISTYVMPQHEVFTTGPDAGKPLPADEFTVTLIGDDTGTKRSLVKAYEESRATLNPNTPNVPAGMTTSFFNLLTDSGSQEPELATVIEAEGNNPPYDLDNYPGSGTNAPDPATVAYAAISSTEVDGHIGQFIAPCGLLQIEIKGFDAAGVAVLPADMPDIDILLHVAPGSYKGVAAVKMGQ